MYEILTQTALLFDDPDNLLLEHIRDVRRDGPVLVRMVKACADLHARSASKQM